MGQFIVLDLEWNQSPAGKEGSMNRLPFEIIEIGAVKLNKNLQIISEFRRLIRPRVYRQMHYKISEVTHMSIEQLDTEGEDFVRAMTEFLEWCGDDYRFCTWGSMDLTELQRNIGISRDGAAVFHTPLLYYDLQKIYAHDPRHQAKGVVRYRGRGIAPHGRPPFHRRWMMRTTRGVS